jgi:hypothetical protein
VFAVVPFAPSASRPPSGSSRSRASPCSMESSWRQT